MTERTLMAETVNDHEMTDEEYERWLAKYEWGTNVRLGRGAPPKEIPLKVYKYWERKDLEQPEGTEEIADTDDSN